MYLVLFGHPTVEGKAMQDIQSAVKFIPFCLIDQDLILIQHSLGRDLLTEPFQGIKRRKNLCPFSAVHLRMFDSENIPHIMMRLTFQENVLILEVCRHGHTAYFT